MLEAESEVARELDLNLHDGDVLVCLHLLVLEHLLELHVLLVHGTTGASLAYEDDFIGRGLRIVNAVLVATSVPPPVDVNTLNHLHVQQLHLHLDVVLHGEEARVKLIKPPAVLLEPLEH